MAVISHTADASRGDKKLVITWANVTESDTCDAFTFNRYPTDISIEADDTSAWGGATLTLVGSNGGTGIACTATDGTTAAWTANAVFSVLQRPSTLTPTFTGGTGQSVTIYMIVWYDD